LQWEDFAEKKLNIFHHQLVLFGVQCKLFHFGAVLDF
jgi:hypothetical protein